MGVVVVHQFKGFLQFFVALKLLALEAEVEAELLEADWTECKRLLISLLELA